MKKTKKFKENRPENYHVHDKYPMWAKNIIPNVVWIDGNIYLLAPSLHKLGYHWSVDAHYLLPTTKELPKCSAFGYGLDQVQTLSF